MNYPEAAGWKSADDTTIAAAHAIDAATLREQAVAVLRDCGPLTADEVAAGLELSPLAIRPRLSELRALGAIVDSGARRHNKSGKRAIVWRLV